MDVLAGSIDELLTSPERGEVIALLALLAGRVVVAQARLGEMRGPDQAAPATTIPAVPAWLDAQQAAALAQEHGLVYEARWFYEHAHELPFSRKFSPRVLRFNRAGELAWLEARNR